MLWKDLKIIRVSKAKGPCSRLRGMPIKLFSVGRVSPSSMGQRIFPGYHSTTSPSRPPPSPCPSPAAPACSPGIPRPEVQPHQALLGHRCCRTTRLGETNSHPGQVRALPGDNILQGHKCPPPGRNERDTGQGRACSEKGEQRTPGHPVSCYPAGTCGCPIWGC